MSQKVYIANTPLILENAEGVEYRVERGEAVELTPEQYQLVAAHVTEGSISAADLATAEEAALPADTPPAEADTPPTEDKPKRGGRKAE
ncbi:hypothetical protein [Neisseria shayeganii]|uniref:Phage protein n=1 Tax=Neisseria shayeganii 871 TaxID=1032488 RepID=G4CJG1_9NEIS|nr:hypothetical protein [Neisseria shayeganii]EGY52012.1 hypothetical protein HMPREF9371_1751 [Neisseria shayeganii 871]